jgi:DNA-binding MarR family transcriptional regulator
MSARNQQPPPTLGPSLNPLQDILRELRETYLDMTCAQALVFTSIAIRPGITQRELIEATGQSDSSISRTAAMLGPHGSRSADPLNLIEFRPDPADRRTTRLFLTKKGQRLADFLLSKMRGAQRDGPTQE